MKKRIQEPDVKFQKTLRIQPIDNGFIVLFEKDKRAIYCKNINDLSKFIENNIEPTGELKKFCDSLDDKKHESDPIDMDAITTYIGQNINV